MCVYGGGGGGGEAYTNDVTLSDVRKANDHCLLDVYILGLSSL